MQANNDFDYIDPASRIRSAISTKQVNDKLDEQRSGTKNDPASRWHRGGVLVSRLAESHIQPAPAVHSSSSPRPPSSSTTNAEHEHDAGNDDDRASKLASSSFLASKLPFGFRSKDEEQEYVEESKLMTKRMEDQNWLEMLDPKHRYGSNIKHYHRFWNLKADTDQNFLQWLDEGDGKDLSLEECPRSKLEAERITYLTPDQRRNYMTYIDTDPCPPQEGLAHTGTEGDLRARLNKLGVSSSFGKPWNATQGRGRLRWCKTGELVSTSKYDHGDLGQGRGIALRGSAEWKAAVFSGEAADVVRSDKIKVRRRRDSGSSSASYTSWNESDLSSIEGASVSSLAADSDDDERTSSSAPKASLDEKHQSKREKWLEKANLGPKYWVKHKLGLYAAKDRQQHIGCPEKAQGRGQQPAGDVEGQDEEDDDRDHPPDALIRRRKADTWLFVADLAANLYIGIKTRGQFQHSSFLGGSIVAAAGILKVKDGIITSIYPWSGHYRSGGEHFEALVNRLRQRGLDTSGINVRKSKLLIEGVNRYGRYRKAKDRKKLEIKERLREGWHSHFGSAERQHAGGQGGGPHEKARSPRPPADNSERTPTKVDSTSPDAERRSQDGGVKAEAEATATTTTTASSSHADDASIPDADHRKAIDHCAKAMASGLKSDGQPAQDG
ncbi:uncharacterized protein PFL1_03573 [Pseudozyma flocculosa PF-1]|uniref:IQ calmodulin-binding motif protein n=2 Tax=Pseudozyma flocculosa TaxID=84751 RepID=A0A5C3F7S5_9BASI|nr:uncharacterized protein PFL1_03573 [Pseudozyma flocculosa PF-1]EPQ28770.1 hypothetical protein PFL1_03573 [Pseudozyma flocculosa PF-1]SPO39449.1 uncharacterized protein PSFLO_04930 [Pseudozyma flocculosa]